MSPYIKNNENVIIIYVGVVDSTPRPYPKILKRFFNLISKILMILKLNWRHYRSPLLLKIYGRPWISTKKYATNIENIIKLFPENKVIIILLNEPGKKLTNIVGNFSVNEYYNKLKKIVNRNLLLVKVSSHLHPDGHHLSRLGHEVISEEIAKLLKTSVIA